MIHHRLKKDVVKIGRKTRLDVRARLKSVISEKEGCAYETSSDILSKMIRWVPNQRGPVQINSRLFYTRFIGTSILIADL